MAGYEVAVLGLGTLMVHGWLAAICSAAEPAPSAAVPDYSARPDSGQADSTQADSTQIDPAPSIAAAQAKVDQARAQADAKPLALARALTALGDAELSHRDFASAQAHYAEALLLTEKHARPNSADLIDVLRGLGYAKAASDQHSAAITDLQRALQISRSTFGLFDMDQQGLWRQLATSLTATGRDAEAQAYIVQTLRAAEQTYGEGDPRMVPVLCDVGDWYSGMGKFREARILFQGALSVLEANARGRDLAAVGPLRAIAAAYAHEAIYSTSSPSETYPKFVVDDTGTALPKKGRQELSEQGDRILQRALEILDATPAASKQTLVDTLLQTGDWFQIRRMPAKALTHYKRAWRLIADQPDLQRTYAQLNVPVRIYYPTPSVATSNQTLAEEEVDVRYVQIEFDIGADGAVTNARAVDHNAPMRLVTDALDAIRAARFRPRLVDGAPVPTLAMSHREIFKLRKREAAEVVR
jgi:tetratricopeptide (TPR) repeat protein